MPAKYTALVMSLGLAIGFVFASELSHAYSILVGFSGYRVVREIPIGGVGQWDYCVVDAQTRRAYISHSTEVVVLDADSDTIAGHISDTQGVHGIALAPAIGRGFTSNGRANTVTIFDLKSLKTIGTVDTGGQNPDAIFYDAGSKRVFTFNGKSKNATAIGAEDGKAVGIFDVGGKPEFATGAGDGRVFVNIQDKSELIQIDANKLAVVNRWSLAPCKDPSGLAMDTAHRRLFAVCDNNLMVVLNADSGKVVATNAIGDGPDAVAFDPETQFVFSSNGVSGNLTVVHEDSPDRYSFVENVPTRKYARTMAIDLSTHNIFLPTAEFENVIPEGAKRPPSKPDSFGVLLVGNK
jgi:DNA-binding beta-propeller fold protein YncE